MAIPDVDRSEVEKSLARFDAELRDTAEWANWEDDVHQKWAIVWDGRRYPPKQIIRLATDATDFSGGDEANGYLRKRGFEIERIRADAEESAERLQIFIFTAGDGAARDHLRLSIDNPIDSATCEQHLAADLLQQLRDATADGGDLFGWGAIPGSQNTSRWEKLREGDYVLTVSRRRYIRRARVVGKMRNADLARAIWGSDDEGATWELMYFLTKPIEIDTPLTSVPELHSTYYGFTRIGDSTLQQIEAKDGSIEAFVHRVFPESQAFDTGYALIRSNAESPWKDREGAIYHFGSTVPNYRILRPGVRVVIDRKTPTGPQVIASAVLGPVVAAGSEGAKHLFEATYAEYQPLRPPLHINEELAALIRTVPKYNVQHAIHPLTRDVYERLSVPGTAWVFAGQPAETNFAELAKVSRFTWTVNSHANRIQVGDRIYMWRYGQEAGIVLVAEVEEAPTVRKQLASDKRFELNPKKWESERRQAVLRVLTPVDPVLSRTELMSKGLEHMAVINAQGGTNFRVSAEEAEVIETLLEARSRPLEGPSDLLVGATSQSLAGSQAELAELKSRIADNGKAAQWWSYPLSEAAQDLLSRHPYLYVYVPAPTKQVVYRFHIVASRTQAGAQGIECPWPEFARSDEAGKTAIGPQVNQTFKTWFLLDEAQELPKRIGLDQLTTTRGEAIEPSVLRNAFAIWRRGDGLPVRPTALAAALAGWTPPGLTLSHRVLPGLIATVDSGRHVILIGPPGTGKTRLAEEFAEKAQAVGFTDGYLMTTASSDWTTFDTLGGYMPDREKPNRLMFERGIVLEAIAKNHWLILDEINRADADKAFGALLTLLAGFRTTLSFRNEQGLRYQLQVGSSPDCSVDEKAGIYTIGRNWRIVATMNTRDKNSLYALSYAFMRRFSFIFVGLPSAETLEAVLAQYVDDEDARSAARTIGDCCPGLLGPAILIDIGRLISNHSDQTTGVINAITAYVIPQFEGRQDKQIREDLQRLRKRFNLTSEAVSEWSAAAGLLVGSAPPSGPTEEEPEEEPPPELDA